MRRCGVHSCCGDHLKAGMLIKFRAVKFYGRGMIEDSVEVFSQLPETVTYSSPPSPPSPPPQPPPEGTTKWCKVGWVRKGDIGDAKKWKGRYGIVSQLLIDSNHGRIRAMHYKYNGAASFFYWIKVAATVATATAYVASMR